MHTSTALPERGQTVFAGDDNLSATNTDLTQLEGSCAYFSETGQSIEGASLRTRPSGRYTKCILVRNGHASNTLAPSLVVNWQDGFRGRRVDALAGSGGAINAGVVDDKLVSAVRPGDLFWLMVEGYARVTGVDASTYNYNEAMEVATGGELDVSVDATNNYIPAHSIVDGVTPSSGLPLVEATIDFRW